MSENRRFASIADLADWLKQKDLIDEEIDAVKSKLWDDGRRSVYSLVGVKADDLKGMGISGGLALTLENALIRKVQSSKRQKLALDAFDIFHLKGVLVDESWQDQERGFTFKGRNRFVENVESYLCGHLTSPPSSPETLAIPSQATTTEADALLDGTGVLVEFNSVLTPDDVPRKTLSEAPAKKRAKALVYSSVSGTGKTVSMLELKRLLSKEDNDRCVVVSYLGFNCCLGLLKEELDHMLSNANFVDGAKEVLARRLAASTIISLNNPNEVSSLPLGENVYKGYVIPNVAESKQLLLDGTKATESSPVYIVAGVDEVQLLNNDVPNGPGLGRLFLRILREWQHEWYIDGIRLLPLGTGIAIDWAADPTLGSNISIHGSDTTLISKEDFKSLVQDAVVVLKNNNKFVKLFGATVDTDTVIDVVSSAYWPRVRLVEFLKNGDMDILNERDVDKNGGEHWLTWLCHWMRDEDIPSDHDAIPGKGNGEGKIYTLFTLAKGGKFRVIPDGYTSSSLVRALKKDLNVPGLYGNLDVVKSLQPDEFMLTNAYDFDKLAFHVVGTSLHAGIYAISQSEMDLSFSGANCKQKRRLGLALWFLSKGAITHSDSQIIVPKVLGKATSLASEDGDFYPFSTKEQIDFLKDVRESLSDNTLCPVYIRCGRRAICDYLYFYHCKSDGSANSELICMIGDGKHSCKDAKSICSSDQEQLFKALRCVASAMEASELRLKFVRLVFVTNKTKLAIGKPGSEAMLALERQKTDAETLFPHTNQELLNLETFEFSPFSDILSAKRSST